MGAYLELNVMRDSLNALELSWNKISKRSLHIAVLSCQAACLSKVFISNTEH